MINLDNTRVIQTSKKECLAQDMEKQPDLKKDFYAVCGAIFTIRAANESSEHYLSNAVCSIVAHIVLHTSNCSFLKDAFFLSVAVETRDDYIEMRCRPIHHSNILNFTFRLMNDLSLYDKNVSDRHSINFCKF